MSCMAHYGTCMALHDVWKHQMSCMAHVWHMYGTIGMHTSRSVFLPYMWRSHVNYDYVMLQACCKQTQALQQNTRKYRNVLQKNETSCETPQNETCADMKHLVTYRRMKHVLIWNILRHTANFLSCDMILWHVVTDDLVTDDLVTDDLVTWCDRALAFATPLQHNTQQFTENHCNPLQTTTPH